MPFLAYENEGEINMFQIVEKRSLNPSMTLMVVKAPYIAKKAKAGQFIILRVNEKGERIPLTIADYDREVGTVTIIFQIVGKTTMMLNQLNKGDAILDFIGPLGSFRIGRAQACGCHWRRCRLCNCISPSESAACYGNHCRYDCRFSQYRVNHFRR